MCVVAFRYGDAPDALAGQLLRIADVEVADLAERFVGALRERLVAYGAAASPRGVEAGGGSAWMLDVTADGRRSQVVATQLDDTLLLTSGLPAMDRLVPLLLIDVTASPSDALPSPSTAPAGPAG